MERYTTSLHLYPNTKILLIHKHYFEKATEIRISFGNHNREYWAYFGFHKEGFRPFSGNILTFGETSLSKDKDESGGVCILIKIYTWEELLNVIPKESNIVLFFDADISGNDLFDMEAKSIVLDYPATVSHLEKHGILETRESTNWLSTDGRAFKIENDIEWWEVDLLGTYHGKAITNKISKLYRELYSK